MTYCFLRTFGPLDGAVETRHEGPLITQSTAQPSSSPSRRLSTHKIATTQPPRLQQQVQAEDRAATVRAIVAQQQRPAQACVAPALLQVRSICEQQSAQLLASIHSSSMDRTNDTAAMTEAPSAAAPESPVESAVIGNHQAKRPPLGFRQSALRV